jgi:alpha-amylase
MHRTDGFITEEAAQIEKLPSWDSSEENPLMMEAFEWYVPHDGRHWQRLQQALCDLKEIGVDNLLLPPGCKAMNPAGNGYDIYDLYDLGEFDQKDSVATKWGTKEELSSLAKAAQGLDMGIIWDAVLNHKAGADDGEKCLAVTVDPHGTYTSLISKMKTKVPHTDILE